ncbi:MAG: sigma-70 family RNA polymerase sigma factor [Alphaproteobacteria bacterium]|nr:sigma-70 family RNA polymerase sigma factor [Alphaproteobacteria bacterium]
MKHCDFCGEPIIKSPSNFHTDHNHYFCNNYCAARYKKKIAEQKNFKQIDNNDFKKELFKDRHLIGYSIRLCRDFIKCRADVEDFTQICRIELWKLLSRKDLENVSNKPSYKIQCFKNAIKRYIAELGINQHAYLDIDPIFFANPEIVTREREVLKALDNECFKELLAQAWSDKNNEELAKEFGTSKQGFIIRCSRQRQRLKELTEWD